MQLYRLGSPTDEESEVAENPICSELSLLGLTSFSSIISDSFIPFCLLAFWYYITNRTRELLEESKRVKEKIIFINSVFGWSIYMHTDNDSSSSNQRNETLVQSLVNRLVSAWNQHDAADFASLLTEDGEWTDVIGQTAVGRKEVERMHVHPFASVLGEAILVVKSSRTKWIKHDVASIDLVWESTGHKTPEGKPIPGTRRGMLNLVVKKEGNGILKIVVGHNVDYTATFTQSDRNRMMDE